ncbi:MAG: OmpH family outer membrane protein [Tannerellaceae bacterium]|jgi:outer membrane protein|nr:OmpH family outer membrane protein [Tannerellaceae bacterium]
MKKLIVLLFMLLPLGVLAQEVKIAHVNIQAIFTAMPEMSAIEKKIADLNEGYTKELKQMEDEYTKKYSDFAAQQDSLTENIKLRRMQEIEDMRVRMENFVPIAREDVQKKQQELYQPIQEKIVNAIKAVGDEKGYTYIVSMEPSLFLYTGSAAIDATPFVKTKLGLQ